MQMLLASCLCQLHGFKRQFIVNRHDFHKPRQRLFPIVQYMFGLGAGRKAVMPQYQDPQAQFVVASHIT